MTASAIEFGLLLHTRDLIRDNAVADFAPLWGQAAAAEAAGFDHIWLGDSVTVRSSARGDCLTTMAALAMATETIGIGTVPMLMALRDPVQLAHALATLDVISRGRLRLGVGVGPMMDQILAQFAACGVPPEEKAGRLSESISLIRRLWAEETVDLDGKYYKINDVGILPKPVQAPTVPIWIAADGNDTAMRRVARLGDGWITTAGTAVEFGHRRRKIDAYAEEYGRSPGAVSPSMFYASFNLDEDGDRARENGWAWMVDFFRRPRDRLGHYTPIFGTPDECVEILRDYAAAGMTCLVARLASKDTIRQTEILLQHVKPRLTPEM